MAIKKDISKNIPLKDRMLLLSNRTDKEELLDGIGAAINTYAQKKDEEIKRLKDALEQSEMENKYLREILAENGIAINNFNPLKRYTQEGSQKKVMCFAELIQSKNKKEMLARLHQRIDGRGGKDVAAVLLKAKDEKLIVRLPTEKEFYNEFTNIRTKTWRAISAYLEPDGMHKVDYSSVSI